MWKALDADDSDFSKIYNAYGHSAFGKFYLMDGYLFKENWLCVPASSLYELLFHEAHGDGLINGSFSGCKNFGCIAWTFLLAKDEKRYATNLWIVHCI
jgi:hypothetical protein